MSSPESSPLLNVEELPRRIKQRARHMGAFGGGSRLRLIGVATLCVLLGYLLTSNLNAQPPIDYFDTDPDILSGPPGFDGPPDRGQQQQQQEQQEQQQHKHQNPSLAPVQRPSKAPTIKGALSSLHHAVSDRFSSSLSSLSASLGGSHPRTNGTRFGVFTSADRYDYAKDEDESEGRSGQNVSDSVSVPPNPLGERRRVGKVTIIFGGAAVYERAVRTHERHDALHHYPLHVLRHHMLDDVWSKPAYLLSILLRELAKPEAERLGWLLWVDADTVLLNPLVPVEVFLPPSPEFDDVHLLVTKDWNGLNNGVFPVRVNQWSADLFAAIVSYRHYRPDKPLVFRDQSAMDDLLKEPGFAKHTAWAPQRWFNAYQGEHNETLAPFQVRRGDFLVHFAGVGDREQRMLYWLERAEEHLPDWEVDVMHTSYPAEARDFWSSQREERKERTRLSLQAQEKANELLQKTEAEITEYHMRLQPGEADNMREKMSELKAVMAKEDKETSKIEEATNALTEARSALEAITQASHKSLLKEAHEAIFAGEKLILAAADKTNSDVQQLEERVGQLKSTVMQPNWLKAEMSAAIDQVRQVRDRFERTETPTAVAAEKAAKLAAIEKQKHQADVAKAELLGIPIPEQEATVLVEGAVVTQTATAMEFQTHSIMVMETSTIEADEAEETAMAQAGAGQER